MRSLTLNFVVCAILLTGCRDTSPRPTITPAQLLMGEGASSSDNLSVTHGNVVVKNGQPGIAIAFVTKPGQSKEFTYFLVFNHDFPAGGVETQSSSDGSAARTFHTLSAFGGDCKVEYRVALKPDTRTVETETTLIADAPYDPSKGKVFVIDMAATPPTATQLNVDLPTEIPNLKETDAAAIFAVSTLNAIRKADDTVDEFCQRVEAKGK